MSPVAMSSFEEGSFQLIEARVVPAHAPLVRRATVKSVE
jgi:hypothetical protein